MIPLVSIITPTMPSRIGLLANTAEYVRRQDYARIEWIIEEDRPGARLTVGEKRNLLVEKAAGEIILHFDDDDYYGPTYVSDMVDSLTSVDFAELRGFYLYDVRNAIFGYWDLDRAGYTDAHYGFGLAYRRELFDRCRFPAQNWDEDGQFIRDVIAAGFQGRHIQDQDQGRCLHIVHAGSTSRCFPQHQLPRAELGVKFPGLML